ncbi:hypothetical protein ASD65_04225 [Microbacterium sp. Root61]|uniref:hypothetical protein n=1 Tax=Microbacterium sp. Root61 TaxID=1736570 RepID=UPI0006FE8A7F|nr:hypothetical protein [Microbacterium sp. Root61]KRA23722.1 hypothetical protein ASD65_04225 [Microbacterium sp. Root61]
MDAQSDNEAQAILKGLAAQTSSGKLEWEASTFEPDEYKAESRRFQYFIRSRDGDGSAPYIFELYTLGAISDGTLLALSSSDADAATLLASLYQGAKRAASPYPNGIASEVLSDLGNLSD